MSNANNFRGNPASNTPQVIAERRAQRLSLKYADKAHQEWTQADEDYACEVKRVVTCKSGRKMVYWEHDGLEVAQTLGRSYWSVWIRRQMKREQMGLTK